jgi:hypothetical protein
MPNNVSSGFDRGYIDMSQAPGANVSFDDLFPPEGEPAAQPQVAQGTPPPQTPQAPQGPFLKAGDTVYNTAEDAVNGTIHKDDYIRRARTFLQENGIDPNEFRRVQSMPQAQPEPQPSSPSPYKYLGNGKQYYQDLASAANPANPDPVRYEQIQRQYQKEVFQEEFRNSMSPYGPAIAETFRQQAIRNVSVEIPDFQRFIESQEYKKTVESNPLLKEMISIGENNPEAAKRLPEVYRQAYLINQGLNRQMNPGSPAPMVPPVQNTPTARPTTTMSPSTMTPPSQGRPTQNWTTDREARKQLIQDSEARGLRDADWGSLGT